MPTLSGLKSQRMCIHLMAYTLSQHSDMHTPHSPFHQQVETMMTSTTTRASIFSIILVLLVSIPNFGFPYQTVVVVNQLPSYRRIELTSVLGPESLAFDPADGGPYTGVSDGRILKWNGRDRGWMEFALPPRQSSVREMCDGTRNTSTEDKCGRPLGLQFHKATGDLYIADAYFGLLKVGKRGGVATKLATAVEGVPFRLTNGVDVDQQTGMVYFTDSSTQFQRREWIWSIVTHDSTGRFMSYNPRKKEVKVLIRNLQFPNGVSLSNDGRFVLVGETTKQRVLRYWLRGPKATTFEVFANVTGYPDNIKRNPHGEFWVAINSGKGEIHSAEAEGGDRIIQSKGGEEVTEDVKGIRFGKSGDVLEVLDDTSSVNPVSEVVENMGSLWFGSVVSPFVGLYKPLKL